MKYYSALKNKRKEKKIQGTSLVGQWLRVRDSIAVGEGSIPGQGTKIPHVVGHGQKKKRKEDPWRKAMKRHGGILNVYH